MKENLLWPTKLKQPPKLLIDPSVMFKEDIFGQPHPLVNISGSNTTRVKYHFSDNVSLVIGFITDVYGCDSETEHKIITLPFQDISAKVLLYQCHGWNNNGVDLLSTPDKTEVTHAQPLMNHASIRATPSRYISNNNKPLFKMEGEDLEDGGSGPQFSSNRAYSGISYTVNNTFIETIQTDFPDMFREFPDPSSSTLAIETFVRVEVNSATGPDGFKIGVLPS